MPWPGKPWNQKQLNVADQVAWDSHEALNQTVAGIDKVEYDFRACQGGDLLFRCYPQHLGASQYQRAQTQIQHRNAPERGGPKGCFAAALPERSRHSTHG